MAQALTKFPMDKYAGYLFMEMLLLEEIIMKTDNIKAILEQARKVTEIAGAIPRVSVERAMLCYEGI